MESKIKQILGEQLFAIAMLQTKNEMQEKEIESLKIQLAAKKTKKCSV